ncbi:biotrophy-associated secreted protein 2 [Phlyctema vagabunda]|uniref:Biotrophy-associated secreted protein 2 n=1 Tax=Phlyctema vagabunda TaxID=108571 RepID=A0ABR4PG36_9HELO
MKTRSILALVSFVLGVSAVPPFDPAGAKNVGNGSGGQFIGGQCLSDADCGSGCCANPTGICSGLGAATSAGKTGCGFTSGGNASPAVSSLVASPTQTTTAPTADAATSNANGGPAFDPSGAKNVGNGQAVQFIGGQCLSNADCASTCCAGPSGICSGLGAQTAAGKTGCGFVSAKKLVRM